MWKLIVLLFVNFAFVESQSAWFDECNVTDYVLTATHFRSKWYSTAGTYRYDPGSSCLYQAIAPPGHYIKATCNLWLDEVASLPDCGSQTFYVSQEGDRDFMDGEYFCGTKVFTRESIGSELSLAYTSNFGAAGRFECSISAVAITAANCDCGWNRNTKIYKGTVAGVNDFTSMVGIYNVPTDEVFCGGAISELKV